MKKLTTKMDRSETQLDAMLLAIAQCGSVRKAADHLKIPKSTLWGYQKANPARYLEIKQQFVAETRQQGATKTPLDGHPKDKAALPESSSVVQLESVTPPAPLSFDEQSAYKRCESIIAAGLDQFLEVGTALLEIRESRLYRTEFGTFEEYCRKKWSISKTHANRKIGAAGVTKVLRDHGVIEPIREWQIRPLTSSAVEIESVVEEAQAKARKANQPLSLRIVSQAFKEIAARKPVTGGKRTGARESKSKPFEVMLRAVAAAEAALGDHDVKQATAAVRRIREELTRLGGEPQRPSC